uniref:Uncharacterized protein n=1 Tax=Acrobeloides nanus TaxID=290746 RepID=A0A914CCF4_9BILA
MKYMLAIFAFGLIVSEVLSCIGGGGGGGCGCGAPPPPACP